MEEDVEIIIVGAIELTMLPPLLLIELTRLESLKRVIVVAVEEVFVELLLPLVIIIGLEVATDL